MASVAAFLKQRATKVIKEELKFGIISGKVEYGTIQLFFISIC